MEENIISLKEKYTTDIDNLKKDYNYNLKKLENLHNEQTEDLNSKILTLKKDLKNANNLNSNLLRISRERANQDRNLRPKKAHNGFIILNRQSIPYKLYSNVYKAKKPNFIEVECFKTKIQTPFNASVNLNLIRDEIVKAFKNIMSEFGIDSCYDYYSISNVSLSNLKEHFYNSNENFIFKECFIANFKSNLWQIDIYTKKAIVN